MKIKYKSNLCSGIISIFFGAILFYIIRLQIGEDFTATFGITSRSIPYMMAATLMFCGAVLIFQSIVLKQDEEKVLEVKKEGILLLYILCLVGYVFIFDKSFLFANLYLGFITLAIMKTKKWNYYVIVCVTTVVLYYIFVSVLHVRIPS